MPPPKIVLMAVFLICEDLPIPRRRLSAPLPLHANLLVYTWSSTSKVEVYYFNYFQFWYNGS